MSQTVAPIPQQVQVHAAKHEDAMERWQQREPERWRQEMHDAGVEAIESARWLMAWFEARMDEVGQQVAAYDEARKGVV